MKLDNLPKSVYNSNTDQHRTIIGFYQPREPADNQLDELLRRVVDQEAHLKRSLQTAPHSLTTWQERRAVDIEKTVSIKSLKQVQTTKNELKRKARVLKGNWRNGVIGVHVLSNQDAGFESRSNARRERKSEQL